MTALMWATKHKNLPAIDVLLDGGADPMVKTETGDTILFQVLENNCWDEQEFLSLWKRAIEICVVDIDCIGKNCRSMLHLAIRRGWCKVVDEFIKTKVNILNNFVVLV